MKPRLFLLLFSGSVGLVGYTVHLFGERPAANTPAVTVTAPAEPKPAPDDRSGRPLPDDGRHRDDLAIVFRSRLERALEAPEEEPLLPPIESRVEAETAFEVIMERIEGLADDGARPSKGRRKRLYRAANDAFAAYSEHLEPGSARDMAALEDAHVRLKVMLDEIDAGPPGSS